MMTEKAMFGAGCFWGVETTFRNINGVTNAAVGYAGGKTENPTYEQVCTDETGHAEVVEVEFDPSRVSYNQLLDVFWSTHNPTTLNRQGPDVGTQYRSVIFYYTESQRLTAVQSKQETDASGLWPRPIVTEITPFTDFYKAEVYHQNFYRQNPYQPYCMFLIDPKMRKFRKEFQQKLKAQ